MKKRFRSAFYSSLSFLILAYIYPGFKFDEPSTILFAGAVFALVYLFIRPLFNLFSLPLNFLTFGIFGLLVNVALLYLISFFVPGFYIVGYQFSTATILGVNLPTFELNAFFSAVVAATLLGILSSLLFWIFS